MSKEHPLLPFTSLAVRSYSINVRAFEPGCCPNLEKLAVKTDKLDVQSIAESFPKLKQLFYYEGDGVEFRSLVHLKSLERLDMRGGGGGIPKLTHGLSFMGEMTRFTELHMSIEPEDISCLGNLKQLRHLELHAYNDMVDISVLAELKQLRTLE